jgi:hypothetical protein
MIMVSIANIQQLVRTGPAGRPEERGPATPAPGPARSPRDTEARPDPPAPVPESQPNVTRVPDYLDPTRVEAYLSRVADAIEQAAEGPHVVGFRPDPEGGGYLVEVRDRNGDLVTTLSPQKSLNRPSAPDDPTGILIDRRT